MKISVLTLVRNRRENLINLVHSLNDQERQPDELIISYMQDQAESDLPETGFAVRETYVPGEELQLAKARNEAAKAATGDILIFLDVDCIAHPQLVSSYADAIENGGVGMGEVLYLPKLQIDHPIHYDSLDLIGKLHPARPRIPVTGVRQEPNALELWGLSFALRKDIWTKLGGMDETFRGYGGEETDFAMRLAEVDVPVLWVAGARAYHQHHPVHSPPLQHFADIVSNARRFHDKHGRWCMEYWLGQFADGDLIQWSPAKDELVVLRCPTELELKNTLQPSNVLYT